MKIQNKQGIKELYKSLTHRVEGTKGEFKSAVQSAGVAEKQIATDPGAKSSGSIGRDYDQVLLEADVHSIEFTAQAVHDAPDVREARVSDIADRIKNGTYNVDAEAIAEKLLASGVLSESD